MSKHTNIDDSTEVTKTVADMTPQQIWEQAGDMGIAEAVRSYGSPYNAAKAAVRFVDEEYPIPVGDKANDSLGRIERKVEAWLVKSL